MHESFHEAPEKFDDVVVLHPRLRPAPRPRPEGEVAPQRDGLSDGDMLSLILQRVMPLAAATDLADRLIGEFGDLGRVVAGRRRLLHMPGVTQAVLAELHMTEVITQRLSRARLRERPVISGWDALIDYCHTMMAHRETEAFRVLYLDRKNILIADHDFGQGTVDHVPVYPREVLKRALELNASSLILVHNHPSGDPTPSQHDIAMTRCIQTGADALGIGLHDHLVIGHSAEFSFRASGLL